MKSRTQYILISTIVTCSLLAFIEHGLPINYGIKTISKVVLFGLVIFIYKQVFRDFTWKAPVSLHKLGKKQITRMLLLGFISAGVVLLAFVILQPFLDLSSIKTDLTDRLGISATGFIWVGLYVTFGNSFLEEYFFRGFIFFNLPRKLAYAFAPVLFAAYHIPMIILWFSPILVAVCFFGLWLIGIIFHIVNEKNKSIWASWMIHICADIMIILIGMSIFYG
ncbi:CPBP family intramembrane glutamic endopeptidase [Virgibacillus sp. LDC-1]|uniref:CPBP family intramembrane glutamic endopeptidase n=1 Tax=Virgibacillus sp. LDC-1 TaxID=3039856 RepID=UPI0024DEE933|nr:CPBP family intramembrane glutamic endopeptidase [Virgibacillus sp. LDC-1]